MGKGKGEPEMWVAPVKAGTVLFEVGGIEEETAKAALRRVAHKMPVRCRLITRRGYGR
jgi:large subunit ribosomal protein L16